MRLTHSISLATSLALPLLMAMTGPSLAAPLQLAQTATVIVAPTAPPPLREEPIPPPRPSSVTTVWETGHWNWTGTEWVWAHGQYVQAPVTQTAQTAQMTWEPGHWMQQPNGWLWVEGRWR